MRGRVEKSESGAYPLRVSFQLMRVRTSVVLMGLLLLLAGCVSQNVETTHNAAGAGKQGKAPVYPWQKEKEGREINFSASAQKAVLDSLEDHEPIVYFFPDADVVGSKLVGHIQALYAHQTTENYPVSVVVVKNASDAAALPDSIEHYATWHPHNFFVVFDPKNEAEISEATLQDKESITNFLEKFRGPSR